MKKILPKGSTTVILRLPVTEAAVLLKRGGKDEIRRIYKN